MIPTQDGTGLLGGALLALACVPLLARGRSPARAAFAQSVLLASSLAGRALSEASWREAAGALALLAAGGGVLRLRPTDPTRAPSAGWATVALGLALLVLGAAAGRQAALLQDAALRDTLGLALPVLLLGLLAACLRTDPSARGAAGACALHGVALAALGVPHPVAPDPGTAALCVAALSGLLVAALATAEPADIPAGPPD